MQFYIDEQVTVNGEVFFVTEHKRGSEYVFLRRTFDSPGSMAYPAHQISHVTAQTEIVADVQTNVQASWLKAMQPIAVPTQSAAIAAGIGRARHEAKRILKGNNQ